MTCRICIRKSLECLLTHLRKTSNKNVEIIKGNWTEMGQLRVPRKSDMQNISFTNDRG